MGNVIDYYTQPCPDFLAEDECGGGGGDNGNNRDLYPVNENIGAITNTSGPPLVEQGTYSEAIQLSEPQQTAGVAVRFEEEFEQRLEFRYFPTFLPNLALDVYLFVPSVNNWCEINCSSKNRVQVVSTVNREKQRAKSSSITIDFSPNGEANPHTFNNLDGDIGLYHADTLYIGGQRLNNVCIFVELDSPNLSTPTTLDFHSTRARTQSKVWLFLDSLWSSVTPKGTPRKTHTQRTGGLNDRNNQEFLATAYVITEYGELLTYPRAQLVGTPLR